mmetsp:Transcript_46379/g.100863  ORF Transcript_46379/g.100863 Transcript_46379/m.100863 type:complete len:407 (+) Transcript_46379:154-1374(+)
MTQESRHGAGQRNAGGWLSFSALFSDGDRTATATGVPVESHREDLDVDRTDTSLAEGDAVDRQFEASELSDIRLDISDIQEAIKNHDLWVQDASAMRTDIDDLQAAIREHETWMAHVSGVVRQIQVKEASLAKEISDIRRQMGIAQPAMSSMDLMEGAGVATPVFDTKSDVSSVSISEKGANGDASESEITRVVLGLNHQLTCGLRMLRTMVTAVEGSLVRQMDSERNARRAAVSELRRDLTASRRAAESSVESAPGALRSTDPRSRAEAKVTSDAQLDVALASLRAMVDTHEQKAQDRSADVERVVSELRTELAALRTEQQLQAVAANAFALSSVSTSNFQQVRQQFLRGFNDGAVRLSGNPSSPYSSNTNTKRAGSAPPEGPHRAMHQAQGPKPTIWPPKSPPF